MDTKLKRNNVANASVPSSVDSIMNPEAPLALRLSGQLLLGVVKIYNKQIIYLFEDCNETLARVSQAYKAGESKPAKAAKVTLADNYEPLGPWNKDEDHDLDLSKVDLSQLKPFQLSGSKSRLLVADDEHAMFRSPGIDLFEAEQFEVSGEDMERHLSMGPIERLREAPEPEVQRLFDGRDDAITPNMGGEDELLPAAPPAGAVLLHEAPVPAPPSSRGRSEGQAVEDGLTGGLTPFDDGVALPPLELQSASPGSVVERPQAAARRRAGEKRRRPQRDVDSSGRPATMLPSALMRERLKDARPTLRTRQPPGKTFWLSGPGAEAAILTGGVQSDGGWLEGPCLGIAMASQLAALFSREVAHGDTVLPSAAGPHEDARQDESLAEAEPATATAALTPGDVGGDDPGFQPASAGAPDDAFWAEPGGADASIEPLSGTGPVSPARSPHGVGSPGSMRRPLSSRKRAELELAEPSQQHTPANSSFIARNVDLLEEIESRATGVRGAKRQRLASSAAGAVGLKELCAARTRLGVARLFADLLTLQSRGKVMLRQEEPYGPISISVSTK